MSRGDELFTITFKGVDELIRLAEQQKKLLDQNVAAAVARTVLWGAGRIAEDCPVDTGRLRSSILGYLAEKYGVQLIGTGPAAIQEGLAQSMTQVSGPHGVIGTNVKYAALVDLGFAGAQQRAKLTAKQLRYLFYKGILQRGPNGTVIYTYKRKGTRSKGYFRNNVPLIDNYFQEQMKDAIAFTNRGELMPVSL